MLLGSHLTGHSYLRGKVTNLPTRRWGSICWKCSVNIVKFFVIFEAMALLPPPPPQIRLGVPLLKRVAP